MRLNSFSNAHSSVSAAICCAPLMTVDMNDRSVGPLTSASLDQLKDLRALDGCGIFFFFRDGPMGAPGGGGTPLRGGRPGGGGPPGGGGGGGGGGGSIMAPGRGGGGGAGPPKLGNGGGGRGPPGGPGMRGGPPGTTACL